MIRKNYWWIGIALFWMSSCITAKPRVVAAGNIPVNQQSTKDSTWFLWLNPYTDSLKKEMSTFVAKADTAWTVARPNGNLNNLITDLLIDYCNHYLPDSLRYAHPEISLMNIGGIRNDLPAGNINKQAVFEMLPFENELVLLKVTGAQLDSLAQWAAARNGEAFAGLVFTLRKSNPKAYVLKVNGVTPNAEQEYWLVTNDYLANGGDNCTVLKSCIQRINLTVKIRDAVQFAMEKEQFFRKRLIKEDRREGRIFIEK